MIASFNWTNKCNHGDLSLYISKSNQDTKSDERLTYTYINFLFMWSFRPSHLFWLVNKAWCLYLTVKDLSQRDTCLVPFVFNCKLCHVPLNFRSPVKRSDHKRPTYLTNIWLVLKTTMICAIRLPLQISCLFNPCRLRWVKIWLQKLVPFRIHSHRDQNEKKKKFTYFVTGVLDMKNSVTCQ